MKKLLIICLLLLMPVSALAYQDGANWAYGTLTASMATNASTFTVTNATYSSAFPTTNFTVVIFSSTCSTPSLCSSRELVVVSSRSGTTFTVGSRGAEGTTANTGTWAAGSKVWNVITEARLTELEETAGTFTAADIASTPAGGLAADDVQEALNELDTEKVATTAVIALDKGGTGTATGLLDSNADVLWGFDDTDGEAVNITIGSGLAYAHATHTLAISGATTGDVVGPTGDVATDNGVVRFSGITGELLQESLATLDDNGSFNIPAGETYNIDGSAHAHAGTEIVFTPVDNIAAATVEAAIAEVATDAAVASSLTSGKFDIARMPSCTVGTMLACDATSEWAPTYDMPIATINVDTATFVDGTDDTKEVNFYLGDISPATNRLLTVQDKSYTIGEHGVTISSASPTIDSAGDIAIDTSANQLKYYGGAAKVLDPRLTENASIAAPASGNKVKFRKPYGMTITSIGCVVDAATSAVLDVQECDANGANCSSILSGAKTCTTTYGTGTVSDSAIAAGGYVFLSVGTVTGSVGYLYVDVNYMVTGE